MSGAAWVTFLLVLLFAAALCLLAWTLIDWLFEDVITPRAIRRLAARHGCTEEQVRDVWDEP